MLHRKVPLRNERGNIVKWYGSSVDIEDRKRSKEMLLEQERLINAILDNSPNPIFIKNAEGRYLLVNKEFERALRVNREQIKEKGDEEVFPPEQAAAFGANDLRVLSSGLPMEFEEVALQEDGLHTRIVHKFPLFDAEGKIYALGGIVTDITERQRAIHARAQRP